MSAEYSALNKTSLSVFPQQGPGKHGEVRRKNVRVAGWKKCCEMLSSEDNMVTHWEITIATIS